MDLVSIREGERMPQTAKAATQDLEDLARRLASRQAAALQRYGSLLSKFGSAGMSSRDFGEGLYQLAVEESARSFGDFVDLGMGYWRSLVGVAVPAERSSAKTTSSGEAKRSRSGARKGAARQRAR